MKNYKIVQEACGVMTRFEPLTAEALVTATQDNSGDVLSEADKHILVYFSLLHDLGRTSEDCDDGHGDPAPLPG